MLEGVFSGVLVGVFVAVLVGVFVGVFVGVLVGVLDGVFVGVLEGVFSGVLDGVFVGVFSGVCVLVGVMVLVGVFVGVGDIDVPKHSHVSHPLLSIIFTQYPELLINKVGKLNVNGILLWFMVSIYIHCSPAPQKSQTHIL